MYNIGLSGMIFPYFCPGCGKRIISRGKETQEKRGKILPNIVCARCDEKILILEEPKCKKCGKQLVEEEDEYCYDCQKNHHFFAQGAAAFVYTDIMKTAIYDLKYCNARINGKDLGKAMSKILNGVIHEWEIDLILPVPMYNGKKMQRGYNQAEILAKEISKYTQIEMYENILTRTRATKPQKDLMGLNRKKNLENAFKISKNVVKLRKILLVDDIYTTGCTIDECAKALLNAGADEVYYVSVCIGTGV